MKDAIKAALLESVQLYVDRSQSNLVRAENLLRLHDALAGHPSLDPILLDDLLRAAVVFCHATLEDLLRSIAIIRLPRGTGEALRSVPLAGSSGSRAEKFTLDELLPHRGGKVDDLIVDSVREQLSRRTFNNIYDIQQLLKTQLGLDTATLEPHFSRLAAMIKRRHQIVHEADLSHVAVEPSTVITIDRGTVQAWLSATEAFTAELLGLLMKVTLKSIPASDEPSNPPVQPTGSAGG